MSRGSGRAPIDEAGLWDWMTGSKTRINANENNNQSKAPPTPTASTESQVGTSESRMRKLPSETSSTDKHNAQSNKMTNRKMEGTVVKRLQPRQVTGKHGSEGPQGVKRVNVGPVTRNPFLNFMRDYKLNNSAETVALLVSQGARVWHTLDAVAKEIYITQARQAPRVQRRQRRRRSRKRSKSSRRRK